MELGPRCLHFPLWVSLTHKACQNWKRLRDHGAQTPHFIAEETEPRELSEVS